MARATCVRLVQRQEVPGPTSSICLDRAPASCVFATRGGCRRAGSSGRGAGPGPGPPPVLALTCPAERAGRPVFPMYRYKIVKHRITGGMGDVFLARQPSLDDRYCVIKNSSHEDYDARFLVEAMTIAKFR